MNNHQFSLFGFQPPKKKVPLSAKRIQEVKEMIARKDNKGAAAALRDLREGLERFESRIK